MNFEQTIKELNEAINGNQKEIVNKLEEELSNNFEQLIQLDLFDTLPFQHISNIVNKVDFSIKENSQELIKTTLTKVNKKYPEDSPKLLNHIKCKFCEFTLSDYISFVNCFKTSEICVDLGEKFKEDDSNVEYDYDYELAKKDKEINKLAEGSVFGAIKEGQLKTVKYWIEEKKVDIDTVDPDGNTLLHCACEAGQINIVFYLFRNQGMSLKKQNKLGLTPIHLAAIKNNYILLETLMNIQTSFDVDARDIKGRTALMLAAHEGNEQAVHVLQNWLRADVTLKDNNGDSMIYYASVGQLYNYVKEYTNMGIIGRCQTFPKKRPLF